MRRSSACYDHVAFCILLVERLGALRRYLRKMSDQTLILKYRSYGLSVKAYCANDLLCSFYASVCDGDVCVCDDLCFGSCCARHSEFQSCSYHQHYQSSYSPIETLASRQTWTHSYFTCLESILRSFDCYHGICEGAIKSNCGPFNICFET